MLQESLQGGNMNVSVFRSKHDVYKVSYNVETYIHVTVYK